MGFAGAAETRAHASYQWGGDWCGKKDGSPGAAPASSVAAMSTSDDEKQDE